MKGSTLKENIQVTYYSFNYIIQKRKEMLIPVESNVILLFKWHFHYFLFVR